MGCMWLKFAIFNAQKKASKNAPDDLQHFKQQEAQNLKSITAKYVRGTVSR